MGGCFTSERYDDYEVVVRSHVIFTSATRDGKLTPADFKKRLCGSFAFAADGESNRADNEAIKAYEKVVLADKDFQDACEEHIEWVLFVRFILHVFRNMQPKRSSEFTVWLGQLAQAAGVLLGAPGVFRDSDLAGSWYRCDRTGEHETGLAGNFCIQLERLEVQSENQFVWNLHTITAEVNEYRDDVQVVVTSKEEVRKGRCTLTVTEAFIPVVSISYQNAADVPEFTKLRVDTLLSDYMHVQPVTQDLETIIDRQYGSQLVGDVGAAPEQHSLNSVFEESPTTLAHDVISDVWQLCDANQERVLPRRAAAHLVAIVVFELRARQEMEWAADRMYCEIEKLIESVINAELEGEVGLTETEFVICCLPNASLFSLGDAAEKASSGQGSLQELYANLDGASNGL